MNLDDAKLMVHQYFRLLPLQIFLALLTFVNTMVTSLFASNFVRKEAMSVFGLYSPINTFVAGAAVILSSGSVLLCGQLLGKNEHERTQSVFNVNLVLSLIVSLVLALACVGLVVFGVTARMTDTPEILNALNAYFIAMAFGLPGKVINVQLVSFLSMENQTRRAGIASAAYIFIHLFLNILFVWIIPFGTVGLALATSVGHWIYMVILGSYFFTPGSYLKINFRKMKFSDSLSIIKVGYPSGLGSAYNTMRGLLQNTLVMMYVGSIGISAYSACNSMLGLFWSIPQGMIVVARMLIGVSIGEEDRKSLVDVMRVMFWRCVPLMSVISLAVMALAVPLTKLYYRDPTDPVFAMTVSGFRLMPISIPLSIIEMHFVCYGQAFEKRVLINVLSALDGCVSVIAFTAILIPYLKLDALYLANIINGIVSILFIILYSAILRRRFPRTVEDLMVIPDSFGVPPQDRIDIPIRTMTDVVDLSKRIMTFCREHGVDKKQSYFAGLAMEEMAGNVISHGFLEDNHSHEIEVRVAKKEDDVILRIKDDCIPFDPRERMEMIDPSDPVKNMGIRLVYRSAKYVTHHYLLGLNVLTMRF